MRMVFLWGLGYSLVWALAKAYAGGSWIPGAVYLAAFVGWICHSGRRDAFGLVRFRWKWWSLWPLALFPIWNLLCGGSFPGLTEAMPVLLAAVAEELFFRGALLLWLKKWGGTLAVVLSALAFATGHLFSGGTVLQFACALAAGVCYGVVTLECGSVFPAMLSHLATNLTGFGGKNHDSLWLCAAISLIWGVGRLRKRKKDDICNFT